MDGPTDHLSGEEHGSPTIIIVAELCMMINILTRAS